MCVKQQQKIYIKKYVIHKWVLKKPCMKKNNTCFNKVCKTCVFQINRIIKECYS